VGFPRSLLALVLASSLPRLAMADERWVHVEHAGQQRTFVIGARLAAGASGTVHVGRDLHSGDEVAIKLTNHPGGGNTFDKEHAILSALGSRRFAHSFGVGLTNDAEPLRALVMERIAGSAIGQQIPGSSIGQQLDVIRMPSHRAGKAVRIMLHALDGIADLHALGYAHNDFHGAQLMADDERHSASTRVLDVGNAIPLTDAARRNDLLQTVEVLARMITGTDSATVPPVEPLDQLQPSAPGGKKTLGDVVRHARSVGYDTVEELRHDLAPFALTKPRSPLVRDHALLVDEAQPTHVYLIRHGQKLHVAGPQFMSRDAAKRIEHVLAGSLDDLELGEPVTTLIR
jgi:serine/threonine protein kinase